MTSQPEGDKLATRPPALFATTHWSVVLLAGRDPNETAQAALVTLCEAYRPPIFSFARGLGFSHADAEDRTQDFFLHFLKNNLAGKIERRESVKFRTFLLRCFKNFLADERARMSATKRGGDHRMTSLDEPVGEGQVHWEPADEMTAEKIYERIGLRRCSTRCSTGSKANTRAAAGSMCSRGSMFFCWIGRPPVLTPRLRRPWA